MRLNTWGLLGLAVAALLSACAQPAPPGPAIVVGQAIPAVPPVVGGAPMYPSRDIVDNASASADHTTLVAALRAADLVGTLKGPGPFTVFAPTNAAFDALPAGTVQTLMQPLNRARLVNILTYHVVAGRIDSTALGAMMAQGNGLAQFRTVSGTTLTAMRAPGGGIMLTDAAGRTAQVTIPDVYQSNGVVHVINAVLLPGR